MNREITLVDVRKEAMSTITLLRENKIDVKKASEIRNLLNVIIDTAKVQIEFVKIIPNTIKEKLCFNEIKQITNVINDKNSELDGKLLELKEHYPMDKDDKKPKADRTFK
jgi:hypothetical protein